MSQLFVWGGQSIRVSALASLLPKNTQGWSPSEWTGWISLQSKGLSRVFSNTTVQKHQYFGAQLSSQSNSHIYTWSLEKPQPWLDGPLGSFYSPFLKCFNHKWVLNFVNVFLCIYWGDHIFLLSFSFLICHITLIDLRILKNPCIPGINPTWSWCVSFLIYCWILFVKILLRIFASMFINDSGL